MSLALGNTDPALRRAWLPLARASELSEQPQAFRLLNEWYAAYRLPNGDSRVFVDRCPHRGAPLSLGHVDDTSLHCAYHGWEFSHDGACVAIPALGDDATIPSRASLRAPARVSESHGMVYVALEEPLTDPPTIAVASDDSFLRGDLPVRVTRASAGLLADNFLDMAHFPFVHAGTFGAGEEKVVANYHVEREGFGFRATYEHLFSHREDPGVASGLRPLVQRRRLTYRYQAPFHLELAIDFLDAGGSNVIGFFLAPEDDETVRIYSSLWRNDLEGSKERMDEAVAFEVAVVEEDLRIQSRYHHLSLPLDPTAEMHTRADKTTVELRRVLRDFVEAARGL